LVEPKIDIQFVPVAETNGDGVFNWVDVAVTYRNKFIKRNKYLDKDEIGSCSGKIDIGDQFQDVSSMVDEHIHIDLKKCNEIQLFRAGVQQVENSEICTVCQNGNWFSHRAENGKTGRFGAFIKMVDRNDN